MCRPLQTIKRKGGGTSLLKERLLKQSQESSYDPTRLRSNVLASYLRRWVFIRRTWFGESCAGNGCDSSWCLSEKKLEARRHAGGVSQSAGEYFSTTGIRLISHFKPLHLLRPSRDGDAVAENWDDTSLMPSVDSLRKRTQMSAFTIAV